MIMTEVFNPFSLSGKTILVTGASSGIGRGIAEACAKMGATIVLTGRNEERLAATAEALVGNGHKSIIVDLALIGGTISRSVWALTLITTTIMICCRSIR